MRHAHQHEQPCPFVPGWRALRAADSHRCRPAASVGPCWWSGSPSGLPAADADGRALLPARCPSIVCRDAGLRCCPGCRDRVDQGVDCMPTRSLIVCLPVSLTVYQVRSRTRRLPDGAAGGRLRRTRMSRIPLRVRAAAVAALVMAVALPLAGTATASAAVHPSNSRPFTRAPPDISGPAGDRTAARPWTARGPRGATSRMASRRAPPHPGPRSTAPSPSGRTRACPSGSPVRTPPPSRPEEGRRTAPPRTRRTETTSRGRSGSRRRRRAGRCPGPVGPPGGERGADGRDSRFRHVMIEIQPCDVGHTLGAPFSRKRSLLVRGYIQVNGLWRAHHIPAIGVAPSMEAK